MVHTHLQTCLSLSQGLTLFGQSHHVTKPLTGELCFVTSMTGYQEIITDPSYRQQIVVFTTAHVGITGIHGSDFESSVPQVAAIVVNQIESTSTHHKSKQGLLDFLSMHGVAVVYGIDTRALVRIIRQSKSPLKASITQHATLSEQILQDNVVRAKTATPLSGQNLSCHHDVYQLAQNEPAPILDRSLRINLAIIDGGIKQSIVDALSSNDEMQCHAFSYTSDWQSIQEIEPHAIIFSNGPGDPRACYQDIEPTWMERLKNLNIPILGICLGMQVLALSYGSVLRQMRTGHHGSNHPVLELATGKVYVSTHNHEFALVGTALPPPLQITHISLFDGTIEGFKVNHQPIFGYQFHPEAGPGPKECGYLIQQFLHEVKCYAQAR